MKTIARRQRSEVRGQRSEVRGRGSVSDGKSSAFPASCFARGAAGAFSLVELLVVIAVIVILAGLTLPVMQAVTRAQSIHRARAELTEIETAIETYKTKLGFYPPDNQNNWGVNQTQWGVNQLYYELMGTTLINAGSAYQTLDGSASILTNAFHAAFGPATTVTGFMNSSKPGAGDDAPNAVKFLTGLKPAQFLAVTSPITSTVLGVSLGASISGPIAFTGPNKAQIVPYCYNSSSPQHNPKSFDLWVDITVGGKTNRISNWSARPIFVYYVSLANSYPP